jgi:hypothetical protein
MRKIWSQFILPMIDAMERRAPDAGLSDSGACVETVWARVRRDEVGTRDDGELERVDD